MRRVLASRIVMFIASGLLLAALIPLSQPYRHSSAWQVAAEHVPSVERALRRGSENFGMSPEAYRRHTRPRIERIGRQTCISLVTHRSDGGGSYIACYDRHGSMVSERALGVSFGAEAPWDRFGQWVW